MLLRWFRSLVSRPLQTSRRRAGFRPGLEALEERTLLSAGDLVSAFNGGKQHVAFDIGGNRFDAARAVAVDSLGRIVVAGTVQVDANNTDFGVIRLNPDGKLDTTFGPNHDGLQKIAFDLGGTNVDQANAVAIDNQGRIVVAGSAERLNGDVDFAVARLKANGDLDTDFGPLHNGRQTVAFNIGGSLGFDDDQANAVALDSQGGIVLAGSVQFSQFDFDFGVARLLDNGNLDNGFGSPFKPGRQTIEFDIGGSDIDLANAMAIDGQGRIVVAGTAEVGGGNFDFALARLNSKGALDTSFGGKHDGKQTVAFNLGGNLVDQANAVAIQPDGKIVAAGSARNDVSSDSALVRLNDDGSLDNKTSFNMGFNGDFSDEIRAVAIQPDGKIVVAGFAQAGAQDQDFALARLNADFSPDNGFGLVHFGFDLGGNLVDRINAMALSPDGTKIIVAGQVQGPNGDFDFGVAAVDTGLAPPPAPAPTPAPTPTPTPTPAPGARGVVAQLVRQGKAKKLFVAVRFADTGEVKTTFRSPFQAPAFRKIKVSTVDTNGDGAADAVLLIALRNGKKKQRLFPV